jgi:hypothetical protein
MAIKESILPEFEHEMETTRVLQARVPESCAQWKPHPKSRSLGELTSHLADLPRFVPWILEVPPVAALRTFLLNHMIHHRGQLTVYLRLQNVPLPSIYGPTADQP